MDPTLNSVPWTSFLRSFGNGLSIPHLRQDLSAGNVEHGHDFDREISEHNSKAIKDWVRETELLDTIGVERSVGGTAFWDKKEL